MEPNRDSDESSEKVDKTEDRTGTFWSFVFDLEKDPTKDCIFPPFFIFLLMPFVFWTRYLLITHPEGLAIRDPGEHWDNVEVAHSYVSDLGPHHGRFLDGRKDDPPAVVDGGSSSSILTAIYVIFLKTSKFVGWKTTSFELSRTFHSLVAATLPFAIYKFSRAIFGHCRDVAILAAIVVAFSKQAMLSATHPFTESLLSPMIFLVMALVANIRNRVPRSSTRTDFWSSSNIFSISGGYVLGVVISIQPSSIATIGPMLVFLNSPRMPVRWMTVGGLLGTASGVLLDRIVGTVLYHKQPFCHQSTAKTLQEIELNYPKISVWWMTAGGLLGMASGVLLDRTVQAVLDHQRHSYHPSIARTCNKTKQNSSKIPVWWLTTGGLLGMASGFLLGRIGRSALDHQHHSCHPSMVKTCEKTDNNSRNILVRWLTVGGALGMVSGVLLDHIVRSVLDHRQHSCHPSMTKTDNAMTFSQYFSMLWGGGSLHSALVMTALAISFLNCFCTWMKRPSKLTTWIANDQIWRLRASNNLALMSLVSSFLVSCLGCARLHRLHDSSVLMVVSGASGLHFLYTSTYSRLKSRPKVNTMTLDGVELALYCKLALYAWASWSCLPLDEDNSLQDVLPVGHLASVDYNACLKYVGQREDAAGVVLDYPLTMTGGWALLDRNVPLISRTNNGWIEYTRRKTNHEEIERTLLERYNYVVVGKNRKFKVRGFYEVHRSKGVRTYCFHGNGYRAEISDVRSMSEDGAGLLRSDEKVVERVVEIAKRGEEADGHGKDAVRHCEEPKILSKKTVRRVEEAVRCGEDVEEHGEETDGRGLNVEEHSNETDGRGKNDEGRDNETVRRVEGTVRHGEEVVGRNEDIVTHVKEVVGCGKMVPEHGKTVVGHDGEVPGRGQGVRGHIEGAPDRRTETSKRVSEVDGHAKDVSRLGGATVLGHKMVPERGKAVVGHDGEVPGRGQGVGGHVEGAPDRSVETSKRVSEVDGHAKDVSRLGSATVFGHKMVPEHGKAVIGHDGEVPERGQGVGGHVEGAPDRSVETSKRVSEVDGHAKDISRLGGATVVGHGEDDKRIFADIPRDRAVAAALLESKGGLWHFLGHYAKAEEFLTRARLLDPYKFESWNALMETLYLLKEFDQLEELVAHCRTLSESECDIA